MDQTDSMVPHEPDWTPIKEAYEGGEGTVVEICTRFGVTKGSLENRCRRDHWIRRSARSSGVRSQLLARMFRVLELHLTRLETMKIDDLDGKEVGLLNVAVRTFEKLNEMSSEPPGKVSADNKEIAEIRVKLARRLDQLKQR